MKYIFCVASAIGNEYGAFNYQQRLEQLKGSIDSIYQYAPDSDIVWVDASDDPLRDVDTEFFTSKGHNYFSVSEHQWIQSSRNIGLDDTNRFFKKTVGESVIMINFLRWLNKQNKKYDRVFKLSGRYQLSENFTQIDYSQHKGKIIIPKKEQWSPDEAHKLRLWSFDYSMLPQITFLYQKTYEDIQTALLENQRFHIIETYMALYIERLRLPMYNPELIGVKGYYGQNAAPTND